MSIVLDEVYKAFGSHEVLSGFSLEALDGETLVIMGESGSGKSVTLKLMVGLLEPDQGTTQVDGLVVSHLEKEALFALRRNVGFVFQFAALFDSLSIGDNVGLGLRRTGELSDSEIRDRAEECLSLVGLEGTSQKFPSELSGGQKKRAGIARAIAARPKYILYDEPTTGLDPITKTVIDRLILRMKEELAVTGVVVTHDLESAYRVGDRIAMLYNGRCRFLGTPEELRASNDPVVRGFVEGEPELMEGES
jgi:phospholipid/cholesterol/gamma-HCH transport system ATP-binding protein